MGECILALPSYTTETSAATANAVMSYRTVAVRGVEYPVWIYRDADEPPGSDWLVVECAGWPGVASQGQSEHECLRMIADAIEGCLAADEHENIKPSEL